MTADIDALESTYMAAKKAYLEAKYSKELGALKTTHPVGHKFKVPAKDILQSINEVEVVVVGHYVTEEKGLFNLLGTRPAILVEPYLKMGWSPEYAPPAVVHKDAKDEAAHRAQANVS